MIYKIGQKTVKGYVSSIPILPADDPIYTRGFTIGGYYSKHSFPPTVAKDLPPWWNAPSPADDHLELGEIPDEPAQTPGASKKKPAAKRTPRT